MPTAIITGANRGLGLEFARQYAADGWTVHAVCRSPDEAADLKAIPGAVTVHRADVRAPADLAALAGTLGGGAVDLLVNNAGVYGPRDVSFGNVDDTAWMTVLRTNVMAPLHVTEAFADALARADRPIVATVSSKMGSMADNGSGGQYIYRSSKAAVNAVVRSLGHDLGARGIICVALHPGWVQTDMGGPNALIDATTSVSGMRDVIAGLKPADAGRFLNYDGAEIPW